MEPNPTLDKKIENKSQIISISLIFALGGFLFGFDAGIQFERNDWHFGLMIRDITTTFNSWSINETEFEKIKKNQ